MIAYFLCQDAGIFLEDEVSVDEDEKVNQILDLYDKILDEIEGWDSSFTSIKFTFIPVFLRYSVKQYSSGTIVLWFL